MNMRVSPQMIEQEIANLVLRYPELESDEQLRADMIEGETGAFEFLSMIVRTIGETNALASGTAEYAKELGERKARLERRIEALRSLAFSIMQKAELRKAELPEATLSLRNGTPKVVIVDETAIPEDCTKVIRSPDKTAIKDKLTRGEEVAGAHLSNGEPSLSIRVK